MSQTISKSEGDLFWVVESEANRQVGSLYTFEKYTGQIVSWYNRDFIFRFVEIHPMTFDDGPKHVIYPEESHGDVWYEASVWIEDGHHSPFEDGGEVTRRYRRIETFDLADKLPFV